MPPAPALAAPPDASCVPPGARLRVRPAPVSLPPYDDELSDPTLSTDRTRPGAVGHLNRLLPLELHRPPAGSPRPRAAVLAADPLADTPERRTPTAELPAAEAVARALVQAVLEVLAGDRPVGQLQRSVSPEVLTTLTRRAALEASRRSPGLRLPRRAGVRSVRVCLPADGVAEVAAVVQRGPRTAAVALRLEGHRGSWRAVELALL